jgi:hypothetical protein
MTSDTLVTEAPASGPNAAGEGTRHVHRLSARSTRRAVAALFAAGMLLVAAGWAATALWGTWRADGSERGVISLDRDGFRYVFHPVTGDEALFDLRADPRQLRNLIRERWDQAHRMRRLLEQERGVESLDALRADEEETIRSLRALGYL